MKQMKDFDIYEIENEYKPEDDIFSTDEYEVSKLKKIIYCKLDETERRIILAYSELKSLRKTAKLFKVSSTTIWKKINEIREKILMYNDN